MPARYAATRFSAKLMQMMGYKTVIRYTYENTVATGLFDDVQVATDSVLIADEIKACGVDSVKSLGKLSLHRKIEASFLEAGVSNPNLFLTVEDMGSVRLYGIVHSAEEKGEVEKLVKQIKEVASVRNDLTVLRGSTV